MPHFPLEPVGFRVGWCPDRSRTRAAGLKDEPELLLTCAFALATLLTSAFGVQWVPPVCFSARHVSGHARGNAARTSWARRPLL
jgi:hypothetical protein